MKRLYTLSLILSIAVISATAQISDFFNRYSDTEGVTSVYISKSLLKMMPDIEAEGIDVKGLSNKLESIRILTTEDKTTADKLTKDLKKFLNGKNYEELLKVSEGKEKTFILTSGDKVINEFLIINQDSDEFNIIQIVGKITPADIKKMVND